MLTKKQKLEQIESLREQLSDVKTLFVMQNYGLSVNQVNELRSKVRGTEATYKVVKNSVVKLAVEGTAMEPLAPSLNGPNAYAFTKGDGVALAKALKEFSKSHPQLVFHRCYLEGRVLEAEDAVKVADMPSREELLGRLVAMLQSPIRRLVVALNAPIQQLASALKQIAETREQS
jgi:large subunit ribosomal protein L10